MAVDDRIETGKGYEGELTVLGLLREMRDRHEVYETRTFAQAKLNESFIYGDQFVEIDNRFSVIPASWPEGVPQISANLLGNLCLTWGARLEEDRPWVQAWGGEAGAADQAASEIANAYLSYQTQVQDLDAMLEEGAIIGQAHGTIGIKVTWDPTRGPPSAGVAAFDDESGLPVFDEATGEQVVEGAGEPTGEISWDLVTIFDYITDGAQHIEHSKFCAFRRYLDEHEATALLRNAKIKDAANVEDYTTRGGFSQHGVETWELWHLPTARVPKGVYAVVCGGHVVEHRDYPYDHKMLPLAVWKIMEVDGCPHGKTHVSWAVPMQSMINELLSVIAKLTRDASGTKLVAPTSVVEAWEPGNGMIPVDDPAISKEIRYVSPPPPPPLLFAQLEQYERRIYDVFGLNEIVNGSERPVSGTPARQTAYLSKMDGQKQAHPSRNQAKAIARAALMTLRLAQQYVQEDRLIRIAGEQNAMQVLSFIGADLAGVDVMIEPRTGIDRLHASRAAATTEDAQAGLVDPARAGELRQSGQGETAFEAMQRRMVQEQARAALQGAGVQPDPQIDPQLAETELNAIASMLAGQPAAAAVQQLAAQYRALAQQAQAAAPPAPAPGGPA